MALEEDLRHTEDSSFKKGIIFIILGVALFIGLAIGVRYVAAVKAERDTLLQQINSLKEENQLLDDRLSSMKLFEGEYKKEVKNLKAEIEGLRKELSSAKKAKAQPKKTTTKKSAAPKTTKKR
ncbi:MAG: hypothetical protein AABY79_07410 [Nitrospirota bacterium]|jgi:cell shape-determining protein MreC